MHICRCGATVLFWGELGLYEGAVVTQAEEDDRRADLIGLMAIEHLRDFDQEHCHEIEKNLVSIAEFA